MPAIIDPNDPEGLVSTGTQSNDLEVRVPLWPLPAELGDTDRLDLFWSGVSSGTPVATADFIGPVDPATFPFSLRMDKQFLQADGQYQLWYTVTTESGDTAPSERRTVTLDTRPPSYNQQLMPLLLPDDLVGGVINEAYLASHGDQVELRLPSPVYLDAKEGDVVDLYWSQDNPPTTSVVASVTVTQVQIDADDIRIVLPGSAVRAPDRDSIFYATYKVRDRAGNETDSFSRETPATVALKPLPGGDLPEPEFPEADIYGYINCDDAPWNGIGVRIAFDRNLFEYQDQITLYWQGYHTFNGVDPIPGTEGVFTRTVSAQNLTDGYMDVLIEPFIPYIEPIIEGSALASYRLTKVNGQSGASAEGLVKINRKLPGGEICGPVMQAARSGSPMAGGCKVCRLFSRFIARVLQTLGRGGKGQ
ncbi:hypothetical protein [Pseudomonas sp. W2-17]|uniref:hypothetical protein n=1 Tax=Pseudomonas sp. W2-17 TaxID=3058039 RepID=UPI0034E06BC8